MTQRRALMIGRLLLGALLVRQGALGMSDLAHLAETMGAHNSWQSWPILGSVRPIQVALWIAGLEFAVGFFLFGGLLTRFMAAISALLAAFALATLGDLGLAPNLAHAVLLCASLAIVLRGGGGGTMDAALGSMQRRSIEREAERDAERLAARQETARDRIPTRP